MIGSVFLRSSHLNHDHLGQNTLPMLAHGMDFRPKNLRKAVDQLLILIMSLSRWDTTGRAWSNPKELHIIWRVIRVLIGLAISRVHRRICLTSVTTILAALKCLNTNKNWQKPKLIT
ncbi:hypothetical protein CDL15_Pgr001433 [Punica granatum]|uniref:Uncharacterized protein n=1 Tax=Punica granatum TaxID=22663 RepID=A0A218WLG9_PUNGR|nr:hypothetical protein CDL15_Pgr001433 [Punica granatum]